MAEEPIYRVPESNCPRCKHKLDAVAGVQGQGPPERGSISACINCGLILAFSANMTVQPATPEELMDLALNNREGFLRLQKYLATIELLRRRN